jgi:hypothetical protein
MSNKLKKKKPATSHNNQQDSVFKEAWENMNEDMSRFMPKFITKRRPKGKGKVWVVVVVTLVELLILGVIGRLVYGWFVK